MTHRRKPESAKTQLVAYVTFAATLLVAVGCGESFDEADLARCETPPASLVADIEDGLTISGGGSLRTAQAVRSNDQPDTYFLAADLEGPGLDGVGPIAVWGVNGDLMRGEGSGFIRWANGTAFKFSEWGAALTGEFWDPDTNGINLSEECVRQAAG